MSLLGNGSHYLKNPGKYFGGGSGTSVGAIEAQLRNNFGNAGASRSMFTCMCSSLGGVGGRMTNFTSVPNGYPPTYAWIIAIKAGGMSTTTTIKGSGFTSNSNLAGGYNLLANSASTLAGVGGINSNGSMAYNIISSTTGSGNVSATIYATAIANAALTGSGDIASTIFATAIGAAMLTGTGTVSLASITGLFNAVAALTGSGTISNANLLGIGSIIGAITGSGDLNIPNLAGCLLAVAAITGSGNLGPTITAIAPILGSLTASGTITLASLVGYGILTINITGSGNINATTSAPGNLGSSILVAGDLLTVSNVGEAVWAQVAEGSYTVEDLLKIIAAATGGKSSGGPNNPIFRNIADTVDRISGTADSSGNRTDVVYDVGD
jgi:hypothetical protein